MTMTAATSNGRPWSGHQSWHHARVPKVSSRKCCNIQGLSWGFLRHRIPIFRTSTAELNSSLMPLRKNGGLAHVISPDISSLPLTVEVLDGWEDEYDGIIIDPSSLPLSANAFASALRASLSHWKSQNRLLVPRLLSVKAMMVAIEESGKKIHNLHILGKKGVWLKILVEQAELVPIAIQEGFNYHHAEPGHVSLTHWIPDGPCILPASPAHQIGVGGFVINDRQEVLVVKEKRPCRCSCLWKIPTGYIDKAEELFFGAVREVKEETGVDTAFQKIVAFRHAHQAAFEKSDLLFVCMLKPLTYEIAIDEKEIQAAKWMPLDEFLRQPFYQDDNLFKRAIDCCIAAHEDHYDGFIAEQLPSKLDGKLSYLYYNSSSI